MGSEVVCDILLESQHDRLSRFLRDLFPAHFLFFFLFIGHKERLFGGSLIRKAGSVL